RNHRAKDFSSEGLMIGHDFLSPSVCNNDRTAKRSLAFAGIHCHEHRRPASGRRKWARSAFGSADTSV
ncbi:MAG: hypothetical protein J6P40_08355, partial [Oscillospiraceae bacterium]|nr:hypothetical protein [Oscillospiraceae bacterium]